MWKWQNKRIFLDKGSYKHNQHVLTLAKEYFRVSCLLDIGYQNVENNDKLMSLSLPLEDWKNLNTDNSIQIDSGKSTT